MTVVRVHLTLLDRSQAAHKQSVFYIETDTEVPDALSVAEWSHELTAQVVIENPKVRDAKLNLVLERRDPIL